MRVVDKHLKSTKSRRLTAGYPQAPLEGPSDPLKAVQGLPMLRREYSSARPFRHKKGPRIIMTRGPFSALGCGSNC
jgi:hypothetical protein